MKKLFLSMLAIATLGLTACSSDDEGNGGGNPVTIDPNDFQGEVNSGETVTLDPTEVYKLTGSFVVNAGGTLIIPAGTLIEATGGTSAYIAVAQDAKIYVNGSQDNPVVMTSGAANPAAGNWGGLVICGNANTNKGGSNGQTATAEVSDLTYGGTNNADNSGSIRYLRVEYTGATFNGSKEFNGLSLFGVGSGTTLEYVQSFEGGDDGIEFFGGAVNGRYLVSINSGDDSIDFADGWSGTGENWYIKGGTHAGIEGSNNGDDGYATPTTTATLKNITIIGAGDEGALYIKEGGGNWTLENIFASNFDLGIKIKNATSDPAGNANVDNDNITISNIQFENVTTITDYAGTNTDFYTEGTNTGAGNGSAVPSWATGWTRF
ncbi:hypothetical protein DFQ10_103158 [Winogradskyella eximia]|jgi:hypothetical protein|uniref:Multidrug transporter n=1 Tax=Winogradskyella eximia TaxID=262006 RepID=A0A3D9H4P4_9FLAO|nr:hypothetical protein [Winogradskyella eximia]RED44474.1 hypothetical protein DFQ10_103158 [Winogradskyella eximia]